MLKQVLDAPAKKAILVLPYVALVQEKLRWLRKALEGISKGAANETPSPTQAAQRRPKSLQAGPVRVVGLFGGSKAFSTNWRDFDIAVCTFEKVYTSTVGKKATPLMDQ